MGDLVGCQVSSVGKDHFAYGRERVDVSLELQAAEIAVPWACACQGELCPPGSSRCSLQQGWGRAVPILVFSMPCPSGMLSWSSAGGEAEQDRWAQTFCGVSCSSSPCSQVKPPSVGVESGPAALGLN